jgi:threonyl-tRNA synthetase
MLKVQLPDGSVREYEKRVRPLDVAAEIGAGLAKATLAAEVDGKVVGATALLPAEGQVSLRLLTKKDPEALAVMRHSAAHVMARAVMRLFDGVQLAFGPTTDSGYYYDFELSRPLTEEDFPAIEAEMAKIIKLNEPFERLEESRERAVAVCRDLGQTLKVEHITTRCHSIARGNFSISVAVPTFRRPGRLARSSCCRSQGPIGKGTPRANSCSDCMPRHGSPRRSWKSI